MKSGKNLQNKSANVWFKEFLYEKKRKSKSLKTKKVEKWIKKERKNLFYEGLCL